MFTVASGADLDWKVPLLFLNCFSGPGLCHAGHDLVVAYLLIQTNPASSGTPGFLASFCIKISGGAVKPACRPVPKAVWRKSPAMFGIRGAGGADFTHGDIVLLGTSEKYPMHW